MIGVDPQKQAVVLQLGALRRRQKVPAVHQRRPVAEAVVLVRVLPAEDDKGVVVVAGHSPDALHALRAGAERG